MNLLQGFSHKCMVVVAPHADDEVLGAGGLTCLAVDAGWEVHALYLTISGYRSAVDGEHPATATRVDEVREAARSLGLSSWRCLFEGEQHHLRLDAVPQIELIAFVEGAINELRPSVAVVPCGGHYHQDHRAAAQACVAALRPAPPGGRHFTPAVLAYGHTGAGWGGEDFAFRPTVFADISDVLDRKLEALACYQSQVFEPPHPRSLPAMRDFHAAWGALAGVSHAEPFENLRLLVT